MSALLLPVALLAAAAAPFVPSTEARVQKAAGDSLRQRGEIAASLVAYRNAITLEPRYAEAHEAMGEAHYAARSYAASADAFARAVELDPDYALAWYNLGHVSRKTGALERARAAFERYAVLAPTDPDARLALADTLRGLGDGPGAAREYTAFLELAGGAPERAADVARAREALASLPPPGPAPARGGATGAAAAVAPSARAAPVAAAPPAAAPAASAGAPSQAVADKLALGDRLAATGDHRGALFAYQDAVYLDPRNVNARVRLGRAYAALRYPEQAMEQYAQATAIDPNDAEARRALDESRRVSAASAATRTVVVPAAASPGAPVTVVAAGGTAAAMAGAAAAAPATSASLPRVYRLPEGQSSGGPMPAPQPVGPDSDPTVVVSAAPETPPAEVAPPGPTARDRYKAALGLMAGREYARAVAELDDAIRQDPTMAVAYAARASARFGLGKYREAANDYREALGLAPQLATPLYGLGECHRILGEPVAAADYYAQYAQSGAADVREDLREVARKRSEELVR